MEFEFKDCKLNRTSLARIETANTIINEYQEQGFTLTLRQLYYQFVARGLLANEQRHYDNLGKLISKGRLQGLIDWNAIEDRTRFLRGNITRYDPADAIRTARHRYKQASWRI